MSTLQDRLVWLGPGLWGCALLALGAQLPGYSPWLHPVAWPGAQGLPGARVFNAMVFVLPGAVMALWAWRLRPSVPAGTGVVARLGASLLLLSALAFAAQGLLPLDPQDLDAGASRRHAAAWTLWWIALLAGASLLASRLRALRLAAVGVWLAVLVAGVLLPQLLGSGLSQRLACVAWFAWMWRVNRALRAP